MIELEQVIANKTHVLYKMVRYWVFSFIFVYAVHAEIVIIGVDGLGSNDQNSHWFDRLMHRSSYTLTGRAQWASDSTAGWGRIFHGSDMQETGILSNRWKTQNIQYHKLPCKNKLPTAMDMLYSKGHDTVTITTLEWFSLFGIKGAPYIITKTDEESRNMVIDRIKLPYNPLDPERITVLHINNIDKIGHSHGWYSQQQKMEWELNMQFIDHLQHINPQILFFLTSDHGGNHKHHAKKMNLYNIQIPFFIWTNETRKWPQVKRGYNFHSVVENMDLFPTLFSMLEYSLYDHFRGRCVWCADHNMQHLDDIEFPSCIYDVPVFQDFFNIYKYQISGIVAILIVISILLTVFVCFMLMRKSKKVRKIVLSEVPNPSIFTIGSDSDEDENMRLTRRTSMQNVPLGGGSSRFLIPAV
jgi:hypothetical protein